jgi:hypothetical protein
MFTRKSPVHKKKKYQAAKRRLSPETVVIIKQCVLGVCVLGTFALLVTGVWYGTRVPALTIATVTASGGETIDPAAVITAAEGALEGEYLKLVPKRFAWFYPEEAVIAATRSVTRVKDPVVERLSGRSIHISYDEYIPYALWCDDGDHNKCHFVDSVGYAFAVAPELTGSALGRYVVTDGTGAVGSILPFGVQLSRIEQWLTEMERVTPLAAELVEVDFMEDVFVTVAGGGEIKFSLRDDLGRVLENLTSILASPEFADIAPGTFQYVDLRFGNKVFVNTSVLAATSTASTTPDVASSTVLTNMVEDIAASVAEVTEPTLGSLDPDVPTTTEN